MLELREIAEVYSGLASQGGRGEARFVRLTDLTDLKHGRAASLSTGELPFVARALPIEKGDLIIGARGATTEICQAAPSWLGAFISLDLYLVRPDQSKIDPSYLAAFLELPATQAAFSGNKQGTGLPRLPKESLDRLAVPLPPMSAQRLIAELARSFHDEAALLQRLANLNSILGREALARAFRAATTIQNS